MEERFIWPVSLRNLTAGIPIGTKRKTEIELAFLSLLTAVGLAEPQI